MNELDAIKSPTDNACQAAQAQGASAVTPSTTSPGCSDE